jgi:hypothetical protein
MECIPSVEVAPAPLIGYVGEPSRNSFFSGSAPPTQSPGCSSLQRQTGSHRRAHSTISLGNFTERFDSLIYAFVQLDHVKQLR